MKQEFGLMLSVLFAQQNCLLLNKLQYTYLALHVLSNTLSIRLWTPNKEIDFTARPKTHGRSIFCLPHRPKFFDFFDLCLHWVSVVRGQWQLDTWEIKILRNLGHRFTFYATKVLTVFIGTHYIIIYSTYVQNSLISSYYIYASELLKKTIHDLLSVSDNH